MKVKGIIIFSNKKAHEFIKSVVVFKYYSCRFLFHDYKINLLGELPLTRL
jgi:hypothetical protein